MVIIVRAQSSILRKNRCYSTKLLKTLFLRPQSPALLLWQSNHVKHGNFATWETATRETLMLWDSMEIKSINFKHALHVYSPGV